MLFIIIIIIFCSGVVGRRKPFKRDPNLDYDVESDEEWEEVLPKILLSNGIIVTIKDAAIIGFPVLQDEPGESLSDCDKDDEEENLEEGNQRAEDEDASEDSFMVPDGYLSENEVLLKCY